MMDNINDNKYYNATAGLQLRVLLGTCMYRAHLLRTATTLPRAHSRRHPIGIIKGEVLPFQTTEKVLDGKYG